MNKHSKDSSVALKFPIWNKKHSTIKYEGISEEEKMYLRGVILPKFAGTDIIIVFTENEYMILGCMCLKMV